MFGVCKGHQSRIFGVGIASWDCAHRARGKPARAEATAGAYVGVRLVAIHVEVQGERRAKDRVGEAIVRVQAQERSEDVCDVAGSLVSFPPSEVYGSFLAMYRETFCSWMRHVSDTQRRKFRR